MATLENMTTEQVDACLQALVEDGYLTVFSKDENGKTLYALTDKGRAEFHNGLQTRLADLEPES